MIRDYLGRKAAERIDRTKFGDTAVGRLTTAILDDERLEDIGHDHLNSLDENRHPHLHYRMFALTIAVNAISWLSVFFNSVRRFQTIPSQ